MDLINKEKLENKRISFFVIDYSQGGGVERVTSDLIDIFKNNGLQVIDLVSLYQVNKTPLVNFNETLNFLVFNPISKKDIESHFLEYFHKNKPDFFIFQGDNMTISLAILSAAKKAKVIAIPQYHGSVFAYLKKYPDALNSNFEKIIFSKLQYPFKKKKLKNFIKSCENGLLCVSENSAKELKSLFDEHITNKIESIRNPVFFHEITNVVKENTVSFVSRLERKHKNAFLIVKTWELLHRSFHDWTLKIYGEGSLRPKMENFIKEKQIKNVEFMGFSKDMNQEFAKSSITVSTSDCEGYPMVVAEAIASKNAIATTRSDGGIWDMIIENKTGLVSDRNRADLLANNIAKLIQNNTLRNQLINNSYEHLTGIVNDDVFIKWKKFLQKKL